MDVAEGGPAGSAGGPAEGVPGAPLSSQALKGQRIFSPVFMVIFIHSTCHPIKVLKTIIEGNQPLLPSGSLVVNLAVVGLPNRIPC